MRVILVRVQTTTATMQRRSSFSCTHAAQVRPKKMVDSHTQLPQLSVIEAPDKLKLAMPETSHSIFKDGKIMSLSLWKMHRRILKAESEGKIQ